MKPVIGVMPLWDDKKDSIWMLPGYMEGIREAGGLPIILDFMEDTSDIRQVVEMCNGFLFTGGHDVSPSLYGENALEGLTVSCEKRDCMEITVLKLAMSKDMPVLGICRGIQFINAALGGTLYQDIPSQYPSKTDHHQSPPYDKPVHEVNIIRETPLYELIGKDRIAVNSYHHQAVKAVADDLEIMAESTDGLVEAVFKRDQKFIWGLQWHPEFSFRTDPNSRKIWTAFVEECRYR